MLTLLRIFLLTQEFVCIRLIAFDIWFLITVCLVVVIHSTKISSDGANFDLDIGDVKTTKHKNSISSNYGVHNTTIIRQVNIPFIVMLYKLEEVCEPSASGASFFMINGSGDALFNSTSEIIERRIFDG